MPILIIIFIALNIYIYIKYKNPAFIGKRGEEVVRRNLDHIDDNEYKTINDLILQTTKGSTQIDHVVVSKYGIFVIETKNYCGWIFGNEDSEFWTQVKYNRKYNFRNPIKQNWAHVYALREILKEYKNDIYYPIVVFSGTAELKKIKSSVPVIYEEELTKEIINNSNIIKLSDDQVARIIGVLESHHYKDKHQHDEHITSIKQHIRNRIQLEDMLICPKCNGALLLKHGPYGEFYGCSNYPKCRYTKKNR